MALYTGTLLSSSLHRPAVKAEAMATLTMLHQSHMSQKPWPDLHNDMRISLLETYECCRIVGLIWLFNGHVLLSTAQHSVQQILGCHMTAPWQSTPHPFGSHQRSACNSLNPMEQYHSSITLLKAHSIIYDVCCRACVTRTSALHPDRMSSSQGPGSIPQGCG